MVLRRAGEPVHDLDDARAPHGRGGPARGGRPPRRDGARADRHAGRRAVPRRRARSPRPEGARRRPQHEPQPARRAAGRRRREALASARAMRLDALVARRIASSISAASAAGRSALDERAGEVREDRLVRLARRPAAGAAVGGDVLAGAAPPRASRGARGAASERVAERSVEDRARADLAGGAPRRRSRTGCGRAAGCARCARGATRGRGRSTRGRPSATTARAAARGRAARRRAVGRACRRRRRGCRSSARSTSRR